MAKRDYIYWIVLNSGAVKKATRVAQEDSYGCLLPPVFKDTKSDESWIARELQFEPQSMSLTNFDNVWWKDTDDLRYPVAECEFHAKPQYISGEEEDIIRCGGWKKLKSVKVYKALERGTFLRHRRVKA